MNGSVSTRYQPANQRINLLSTVKLKIRWVKLRNHKTGFFVFAVSVLYKCIC